MPTLVPPQEPPREPSLAATVLAVIVGGMTTSALADPPVPLNNRYVCVITEEHPSRQGICVWAPLPVLIGS